MEVKERVELEGVEGVKTVGAEVVAGAKVVGVDVMDYNPPYSSLNVDVVVVAWDDDAAEPQPR